MKLTFAGVGSAFTTQKYWQSNMVMTDKMGPTSPEQHLLIDAGGDIRFSLAELGLYHRDISHVYISHLHTDHIGGLEFLGFCTYFDPTCERPRMYIVEELVDDLWRTLQSGMQSHEGKILNLNSFFDVHPIEINSNFDWCSANFTPVQTVHVMNGYKIAYSYGLIINRAGKKYFITTDTQFCPRQIEKFYLEADVIFQDCETAPYRSNVHAHYDDLKTLDAKIKKKMWLYHYQPDPKQDTKKDGFAGFLNKGQVFEL